MADAILVAESIRKRFGRRQVLASAHLHARVGAIVALIGRNGSGKSTLLRIAAGLMKADGGTIRFKGRIQARPALHRMAREGLFFAPAVASYLSGRYSLEEHLDGTARQVDAPGYDLVVETLHLASLLPKKTSVLSHGERRRALIALAMLRDPACLLVDEPCRDCDPIEAEHVMGCLRLLATRGCAVVLADYRTTILFPIIDEVLWLREGVTQLTGTVEQTQLNVAFRSEFLGVEA